MASPDLRPMPSSPKQFKAIQITRAILPKSDLAEQEMFWDPKKSQLIKAETSSQGQEHKMAVKNKTEIIRNIEKLKKSLPNKKTDAGRELQIMNNI